MSAEVIQTQYDNLQKVADRFARQAGAQRQMQQRLAKAMQALQNGGWQGKGSAAFFAEMNGKVLPVLRRLQQALEQAQRSTQEINQIVKAAEEEAAAVFKDGKLAVGLEATGGVGNGVAVTSGGASASSSAGPVTSGPFTVGPAVRPDITHDNGFLDQFPQRPPTAADQIELLKWKAKVEAAEAFRPDLVDGTAAYRHFLEGNGADRTIAYERYLENDPSGQTTLKNLISDAQKNAEVLGNDRDSFSMTSRAYQPGGPDARFPYPATENWQKAIGGHAVWTSADVQVSGTGSERTYTMTVTIHAEDRYNFNPGQQDIATGIPDSANGVFEITGLAHQYTQRGEVTRVITWKEGDTANAQVVDTDTSRNRSPSENRRLRNQI